MKKHFSIAAAIVGACLPSQVSATVTTFGSYTQVASGAQMNYNHDTQTLSTTGYQTYLNVLSVANILTTLTFSATTSDATVYGNANKEVDGFNGSFSFALVNDATISNKQYTAGSILFSGTFTDASLVGRGTSGSVLDATTYGTISYYSPAGLLDFGQGVSRDLSIALTQIDPGIAKGADNKLQSFSSASSGNFSSDPAPVISNSVPEASTWVMMILGFGLVGIGLRRRGTALALG